MDKIRVGVLRGGISPEYYMSLENGGRILALLSKEKYKPVDLLITKDGVLHANGLPIEINDLPKNVDVVFNALYGYLGDDGKIQEMMEGIVPFTGSNASGSMIASNKALSKKCLDEMDEVEIKFPKHYVVYDPRIIYPEIDSETFGGYIQNEAKKIFSKISPPWVVKPIASNFSIGLSFADNFNDLAGSIASAFENSGNVMVEEYIDGREFVAGIIEGFRGEDDYFLIPHEVLKDGNVVDSDLAESADFKLAPIILDDEKKDLIKNLVLRIKNEFGLRHYFTVDFIVKGDDVYVLEINNQPNLKENSIFQKKLESVGATFSEFLDHIISLALDNKQEELEEQGNDFGYDVSGKKINLGEYLKEIEENQKIENDLADELKDKTGSISVEDLGDENSDQNYGETNELTENIIVSLENSEENQENDFPLSDLLIKSMDGGEALNNVVSEVIAKCNCKEKKVNGAKKGKKEKKEKVVKLKIKSEK